MKVNQILDFIASLLSGAVVGAAVVLLLAPQSGIQTRQQISDQVHEIIDAGKQTIAEKRQELRAEYKTAIRIPVQIPVPIDQAEND